MSKAAPERTEKQCPSVHKMNGQRCIREAGHDGYCWSKAQRGIGCITRAEWSSENGRFTSHYQYNTKYPANTAPEGQAMNPNTMTLDELRDWCARDGGWMCSTRGLWWRRGGEPCTGHPYPPTLDGAASAMPKGWKICTLYQRETGWMCFVMLNAKTACDVMDQPSEIHARYLVAVLARMASKEDDAARRTQGVSGLVEASKANARIAALELALSEQAEAVRVLATTSRDVAAMLQRAYDKASLSDVANAGWCAAAMLHAIQDLQAALDAARSGT